jgi:hypothetical protein
VQQTFATVWWWRTKHDERYGTRSSEQFDAGRFEKLNSVIYPLSSVSVSRAHKKQKAVAERKDESARA